MHGRAKVPTTREQDEAKTREHEKKVESYRKATSRIYSKRSAGELDEEALTLTESVLRPNPEILTLWNYRREVFLKREEDLSKPDYRALLQNELGFLEACLRVNPKAYGVWLHREWVMLHIPDPDWKQELGLCDLFLKYDERNFHCWDYRRVVIKHAGVPPTEELQFTYKKIASNFSNSSAWHQRSKLLPQVHPSVTERALPGATEEEFELLQNAFFTDPGDQSAWFYHRWLLGKATPPLDVLCLLLRKAEDEVVAVFNKPILISGKGGAKVIVNGEQTEWLDCRSPLAPPSWPSQMWVYRLPPSTLASHNTIDVLFELNEVRMTASIQEGCSEGWSVNEPCLEWIFQRTAVKTELVQRELEMCKELLELEPHNKWCILTTLTLSQAIDPIHYYDDIVTAYEKLSQEDPHRRGYYEDQKSKFTMQTAVYQFLKQQEDGRKLDLSHKGLTHLYSPELMCLAQEVCLEGNNLTSCAKLSGLLSAQGVNLKGNKICAVDVELARLSRLTTLNLDGNPLSGLPSLEGLRGGTIKSISLADTPVLKGEGEARVKEHLQTLLPSLEVFNGRKL